MTQATLQRVDDSFDSSVFARSSCAFGVFDGLHRGHRYLIERACTTAAESCDSRSSDRARSIVLTFDIDPDEVFHPERLQKLMTNEERLAALAASGVDDVVVLPFTQRLYSLDPHQFLATTFSSGAPAHMHVGEDIRFGARAVGTVQTLREWGARVGCQIHAHSLIVVDGAPVTSTRIRLLLAEGNDEEAQRLLGHGL